MRLSILIRRLQALPTSPSTKVDRARRALIAELASLPNQRVRLRLDRRGLVVPEAGYTLDQALAAISFFPPRHRARRAH